MFSFAVPDPSMPDPSKQPKNQLNPIGSLQVSHNSFSILNILSIEKRCHKVILQGVRQGINILKIK